MHDHTPLVPKSLSWLQNKHSGFQSGHVFLRWRVIENLGTTSEGAISRRHCVIYVNGIELKLAAYADERWLSDGEYQL